MEDFHSEYIHNCGFFIFFIKANNEERVGLVGARMDKLETRMDKLEARMETIDKSLKELRETVQDLVAYDKTIEDIHNRSNKYIDLGVWPNLY